MDDIDAPVDWHKRYINLRQVYLDTHPRLTLDAIDAFVDGRIAQTGIAAGDPAQAGEPSNGNSVPQGE